MKHYLVLFISCMTCIQSCISTQEKYVDPYNFTLSSQVTIPLLTKGLAIMGDINYSLTTNTKLVAILEDTLITVNLTDVNGQNVNDKMFPVYIESLDENWVIGAFISGTGSSLPNKILLINISTGEIKDISSYGQLRERPKKTLVVKRGVNNYGIIANGIKNGILKISIQNNIPIINTFFSDTMSINDFMVDKDENFIIEYENSSNLKHVFLNKEFQKVYYINNLNFSYTLLDVDSKINFLSSSNQYKRFTNSNNIASLENSFNVGLFFHNYYTKRCVFNNAMYLMDGYNFLYNQNSTFTSSQMKESLGIITSFDYSVSNKLAYISTKSSFSDNYSNLVKIEFSGTTITETEIINNSEYDIYDIEVFEDGSFYYSGLRLSDNKYFIGFCTSTGTLEDIILLDSKVSKVLKTTEYVNRFE